MNTEAKLEVSSPFGTWFLEVITSGKIEDLDPASKEVSQILDLSKDKSVKECWLQRSMLRLKSDEWVKLKFHSNIKFGCELSSNSGQFLDAYLLEETASGLTGHVGVRGDDWFQYLGLKESFTRLDVSSWESKITTEKSITFPCDLAIAWNENSTNNSDGLASWFAVDEALRVK